MADSLLQPGSNLDQEGPDRVLAAPLGPADEELIFSLASSQHEGASGEAVVTTEHCLSLPPLSGMAEIWARCSQD